MAVQHTSALEDAFFCHHPSLFAYDLHARDFREVLPAELDVNTAIVFDDVWPAHVCDTVHHKKENYGHQH
jgi:hypothetical protein